MSGDTSADFDVLTLSEAELVHQACDRFETEWRATLGPLSKVISTRSANPAG